MTNEKEIDGKCEDKYSLIVSRSFEKSLVFLTIPRIRNPKFIQGTQESYRLKLQKTILKLDSIPLHILVNKIWRQQRNSVKTMKTETKHCVIQFPCQLGNRSDQTRICQAALQLQEPFCGKDKIKTQAILNMPTSSYTGWSPLLLSYNLLVIWDIWEWTLKHQWCTSESTFLVYTRPWVQSLAMHKPEGWHTSETPLLGSWRQEARQLKRHPQLRANFENSQWYKRLNL